VLRDAAAVDSAEPAGVYFGTRGGTVYASADEGETFTEVAAHLPDVLCVRAAVISSAVISNDGLNAESEKSMVPEAAAPRA